MKILYIILDGWPTFRPDVEALWGRHLPRHGIFSDLVTQAIPRNGDASPAWPAGRELTNAPHPRKIIEQAKLFAHTLGVLIRAKRGEYDAIQVRDLSFITLFALWRARSLNVPFYYWMSFPMAEVLARKALSDRFARRPLRSIYLWLRGTIGGALLYRLVLPAADHIFVQSEKMADDLARLGLKHENMTPVPMGIDPELFPAPPACPAEGQSSNRGMTIAYLGSCEKLRRLDFLIEVLARIRNEIPDTRLKLIGDAQDPADMEELREKIQKSGLTDQIEITGWLPAETARKELQDADLALAYLPPDPLFDVASPTKLIEYMAMGMAVVASEHPEQSRVIAESGAGLCAAFDADAFASAVVKLLNAPHTRQEMGRAGRIYALRERGYDVISMRLARKYQQLMAEPDGTIVTEEA